MKYIIEEGEIHSQYFRSLTIYDDEWQTKTCFGRGRAAFILVLKHNNYTRLRNNCLW